MSQPRTAILYRMILPDHTCPFGVRARQLLIENGYELDDRILHTREETDCLERELGVATTPQVFIGGELIGGCDDLEAFLGED